MAWNTENWAQVWTPLAGWILKELFWLILGKKKTKARIVKQFAAAKEEKKKWIG